MAQHVIPVRTYLVVFISLLVLLVMTVVATRIEHGVLNIVVALTIAGTKAALIVLFFMHVKYNAFVIRLAVVAGFFWLAILLTFTLGDYMTRGEISDDTTNKVGGTSTADPRKAEHRLL